jgi:Kef-type K+ transport system membrane component KefB
MELLRIAAIAFAFLAFALTVGRTMVPRLWDRLGERARPLAAPLAVALALAAGATASLAGLAPIVGAFAAGLVLAPTRRRLDLLALVTPLAGLFVSFFFVTLGMRLDVAAIGGQAGPALAAGLALSALAILGKLASGWGVVRGQASRLVVGVGMAPRGEVGLIFASLGLASGLLGPLQYSVLLLVVLATTLATPIWLARLGGHFKGSPPAEPGAAT